MNPIILSLQLWLGQTRFFCLGEATSLEKENSEFKPVKLRLKIDLVSYPAWADGLVNMIIPVLMIIKKNVLPIDSLFDRDATTPH